MGAKKLISQFRNDCACWPVKPRDGPGARQVVAGDVNRAEGRGRWTVDRTQRAEGEKQNAGRMPTLPGGRRKRRVLTRDRWRLAGERCRKYNARDGGN